MNIIAAHHVMPRFYVFVCVCVCVCVTATQGRYHTFGQLDVFFLCGCLTTHSVPHIHVSSVNTEWKMVKWLFRNVRNCRRLSGGLQEGELLTFSVDLVPNCAVSLDTYVSPYLAV